MNYEEGLKKIKRELVEIHTELELLEKENQRFLDANKQTREQMISSRKEKLEDLRMQYKVLKYRQLEDERKEGRK